MLLEPVLVGLDRQRPHQPDMRQLELLFAKLKALLRKAAERSITALWDRIGELLNQFSADECRVRVGIRVRAAMASDMRLMRRMSDSVPRSYTRAISRSNVAG